MKTTSVLVAYFDDEQRVLEATRTARETGLRIHDVYTPYAVHGMDDAMGLRRSRLTWVCLATGLLGLCSGIAFQYYVSVVSWPINVGGKPLNSAPAFIPVAFELTVLFASLLTVAALFFRTRLFPGASRLVLPRVTDDRFALAITPDCDSREVEKLMRKLGALEVHFTEVSG